MATSIHVIINPAAGRDQPVLNTLNTVFNEAGLRWQPTVTHQIGDARRAASQALERGADAIAVYGGDGTVAEVAGTLAGTDTPLGILPGGTANVMAKELGIPPNLEAAARLLVAEPTVQRIDMGRMGDRLFMVRINIGVLADMATADQSLKDQLGTLAYALKGLQAIQNPTESRYTLEMDSETVEIDGITAFVANSGNMALQGVSFSPDIDVTDGLLDVMVIRKLDLSSMLAVAASAGGIDMQDIADPLPHWQTRSVTISVDPPQPVELDGEACGEMSVTAAIEPRAVCVYVPSG